MRGRSSSDRSLRPHDPDEPEIARGRACSSSTHQDNSRRVPGERRKESGDSRRAGEPNSTNASEGSGSVNDIEIKSIVDVKTAQDVERSCVDLGTTNTLNTQPNKTGLTINAEIHRCYQNDTFSTLNLSNWNNLRKKRMILIVPQWKNIR
ncbi:hypothetical protein NDU88_005137 [Pleurodeles waltl]|uniref:Uncharacterized protein n=1 Tax=Pleurodeles waltl TaxID=8319 RepID=A0AAV7VMN3_PLEWA|nr:hypothetical protein NDU88_005137 [Pleurodeles waltl]